MGSFRGVALELLSLALTLILDYGLCVDLHVLPRLIFPGPLLTPQKICWLVDCLS